EPLLQLDKALIDAFHARGFEVGVETNGTLPAPEGLDWICVSPKADAPVVIETCDELKLVYPQPLAPPERFRHIKARYYFLSPMADPQVREGTDPVKDRNTRAALEYCLANPRWRLSLQMHKLLGIEQPGLVGREGPGGRPVARRREAVAHAKAFLGADAVLHVQAALQQGFDAGQLGFVLG